MRENKFQAQVIRDLHDEFPGSIVLKNDANYLQGIPDITLFWQNHWAMIECKKSANEPYQPNQPYYLELAKAMSYSATIYPGNEREVYDGIRKAFESQG